MFTFKKFEIGKSYKIEFEDGLATGRCVEIKETLSDKEVVFEIGYKYYRCDAYDSYEPSTCAYSEYAECGDYMSSFAVWEEV